MEKQVCPKCGKTAKTEKTINEKFGFRSFRNTRYSQLHCKQCRKNKNQVVNVMTKNLDTKKETRVKFPKSIWENLTEKRRQAYRDGHKKYIDQKRKETELMEKVTKKGFVKYSKRKSLLKKSLHTLKNATMNKPKKRFLSKSAI